MHISSTPFNSEPNGSIDSIDFAEFGAAFGSSGTPGFSIYDYDNNGNIDAADFAAFGSRFGISL